MTRVVNLRSEAYTLYIGRGSKWGNPFVIGRDGNRAEVITKYERYLHESGLINSIHEIDGHTLGCYCKPLPCHGDVLIEALNKTSCHETILGNK
jgi:hypothetical protein